MNGISKLPLGSAYRAGIHKKSRMDWLRGEDWHRDLEHLPLGNACRPTHARISFLDFSCVCVSQACLGNKEMIFGHKMARKGQTIALPAGTVTLKLCPFADASSIDPGPEPFGTCGRRRSETLEIKCGPKRKDGGAKGSRN
jgi:hypothetical protein